MPIAATSVVSAAVIGGDLILGLSDGAIINAGRVQGPTGLTGPQGPMGATGRAGLDGNTIHTVAGAPDGTLGRDGDFAINSVAWEIYGPKAGGTWGTGTPMLGGGERNQREVNKGGSPKEGQAGGENRPPIISPDGDLTPPTQYPGAKPIREGDFWVDGNGALHVYYRGGWHKIRVYSDMVLPAGDAPAGSTRDVDGSVTVPGNGGTGQAVAEAANGEVFANQYEYNNWLYYRVDRPPIVADDEPAEHPNFPVTGLSAGDFWINAGNQIYTWKANQWTPLFAKGLLTVQDTMPDPANSQEGELWFNTEETHLTLYVFTQPDPNEEGLWVPASPPVSLDGVEDGLKGLASAVDELRVITTGQGNEIADAKSVQYGFATAIKHLDDDQQRQDEKIAELEGEVDDLKPTIERGEWLYNSAPEGDVNTPQPGEYHAFVIVSDDYCKQKLGDCLLSAGGDTSAASQCNRENEDCLKKVGESDTDVPWHEVQWVTLSRSDQDGRSHSFGDVVPGMYLEAINLDGTGHGLYVIETKSTGPTRCGFFVSAVHSTGHPNGKAVIKVFKMAEAAHPEDYLKKSGDEMTGKLYIKPPKNHGGLWIYPPQGDAGAGTDEKTQLVRVANSHNSYVFYVEDSGAIAGKQGMMPTEDRHLTSKKYVDAAVAAVSAKPGPFTWRWEKRSSGTASSGCMWWESSKFLYLSQTTAEGALLDVSSSLGTSATIFQSYYSPDYKPQTNSYLKFWQQQSNGAWKLMAWATPYKYRFGYRGWVQIEYKSRQGSLPDEAGSLWCITLPELF